MSSQSLTAIHTLLVLLVNVYSTYNVHVQYESKKRYSLAGIVKRSPSIIVLDIGITVSFSHQISDYIEMPIPGVKNSRKVRVTNIHAAILALYIHVHVHVHVHVYMYKLSNVHTRLWSAHINGMIITYCW